MNRNTFPTGATGMILVTGATGNNGREIIKGLATKGAPVRAMVRDASKSASVPPTADELVEADFDDAASLERALEGVDRAFLVTPSSERVEEQQLRFVALARAAGVRHIVYLSQLHAAANSPVRFLRYHAAVEAALAHADMTFTNVRPNLYMQGLLLFKPLIATRGEIMAPAGEAAVSVVDVRDIAEVAVAALIEPHHEGKSYDITGPDPLTHAQMTSRLSNVLGKAIEFRDVPGSAFRSALLEMKMPEWQADGLIEDYEHYSRGEAAGVSIDFRRVTGHEPRSFDDFARDFKDAFVAT